jgi:hypothetical protein
VDFALVSGSPLPIDQGLIALPDLAILKKNTEVSLRLPTACHYHDSRRCHVQAMDGHGVGKSGLDPGHKAVGLVGTAPGDGKQATRLIDDYQFVSNVENREFLP